MLQKIIINYVSYLECYVIGFKVKGFIIFNSLEIKQTSIQYFTRLYQTSIQVKWLLFEEGAAVLPENDLTTPPPFFPPVPQRNMKKCIIFTLIKSKCPRLYLMQYFNSFPVPPFSGVADACLFYLDFCVCYCLLSI